MSAVDSSQRRAAFSDIWMQIVVRALNLGLGIGVTILVVRTLGDAGYGQWLTIMTTVQLAGYFMSLGLERVTVREAAADPGRAADWIGALITMRLLLTIPVAAVGLLVIALTSDGHRMFLAGAILVLQFPLGIGSSLVVVHQLQVRNRIPMVLLTVNSVLWGVLVAIIWALDGGLVALAIALTSSVLVTSVLQAVTAVRAQRITLSLDRVLLGRLLRTGAPMGLAGLLIYAYARIDQVIVFEIAGARPAGYYGAAYRMLEQAHFVPISVLTTVAPLIASQWVADRERMLRIVTQAGEFLAIASFGGLAFAVAAAGPVVGLVFGPEFAPTATVLPILAGAFVFICFGYLTGNLLLVLGLASRQIVVGVVALVVNVIANLVLVPEYGFVAAAWITLATEVVVVGTGGWFILRRLAPARPALGRLPQITLAAALLAGLLLALESAGTPLLLLCLATAVAYPALLLALRGVERHEVADLLRRA